MSIFDKAFEELILVEGGYSNDPRDSGGKTMYGVTERVARKNGYLGPMDGLPLDEAKRIYKSEYWDINDLDGVAVLSPAVARELFDTGVNCGPGIAAVFLQRALNVFNRQGADFPDVEVDGDIGPSTAKALSAFLGRRAPHGEKVLLRALNSMQGARYVSLAEAREKDEAFAYGWFLRRVVI